MKGTVIFFSNAKGWGFLKPEDGDSDLFVHHTSIDMEGYRTLKEGEGCPAQAASLKSMLPA